MKSLFSIIDIAVYTIADEIQKTSSYIYLGIKNNWIVDIIPMGEYTIIMKKNVENIM